MRKKGFTLAEVLITLSIIGVVAALTIPALMRNYQESMWKTAFKKNYAVISQAVMMVMNDHGGTLENLYPSCGNDYCTSNAFGDELAKYLTYTKQCLTGTTITSGCWYSTGINYLNDTGTLDTWRYQSGGAFVLKNGAIVSYIYDSNDQSCTTGTSYTCGDAGQNWFVFDVNGSNGPNTLGKDVYFAYMTKTGLKPGGITGVPINYTCTSASDGLGCAVKVLQNIDY